MSDSSPGGAPRVETMSEVHTGGPAWLRWGAVPAAFFGALFLCERQGLTATGLALALAFLLLGLPWTVRFVGQSTHRPLRTLVWFAAGCIVLLASARVPHWWRPSLAALALYCWSRALTGRGDSEILRQLAGGFAIFAVVLPALDTFPPLLAAQESWGAFLSGLIRAVTGRPLSASASALGLEACLLFLCIVAAVELPHMRKGGRGWRRLGAALLLAHVGPVGGGLTLAFLPGFDAPLQLSPEPTAEPLRLLADVALQYTAVWSAVIVSTILAFLLPVALRWGRPEEAESPASSGVVKTPLGRRRRILAAAAVGLLCFAGGLGPWLERPVEQRDAKVLLYEQGYLNWLRADFDTFGPRSAGMLGFLPDFLESIGLRAERDSSLTPAALRDTRVLFMLNPETALSEAERRLIWQFVRRGGHFVLVGEHTWRRGPMGNVLNVLLEPSDIRFRTDSANFLSGGWIHGYRFLMTPLTSGLHPDRNDLAFVVGASLEVGPKARPLVMGRWGYSDTAALADSAGGYLGDLSYAPGEPFGDVVLMATQRVGRGRVTVFGDTSAHFNAILAISYEFLSRVFRWAAAAPPDPPFRLYLFDVALALLLGLALAALSGRATAVLVAGSAAAMILGSVGYHQQSSWPPPFVSGDIAFVDTSHLPQYPHGDWDDDKGIMGLPITMMRYGYQTHFLDRLDPDVLQAADVLAIVAPRRTYSKREADMLSRWVDDGGTLLLSVGAEEEAPVRRLLDNFGLALRHVPLGHVPAESAVGEIETSEAWPVELVPLGGAPPDAEVLLSWQGHTIAVRLPRGRGQVVMIADSRFFCNYNLEHDDHGHVDQMEFLGSLLPPVTVEADAGKPAGGDGSVAEPDSTR